MPEGGGTVAARTVMIDVLACTTGAVLSEAGGTTCVQPGREGVEMHCATLGSTALQPANVGDAVHWARVGSTALQPAIAGDAVH